MSERKEIDLTPTWVGLLPLLLHLYEDGVGKNRDFALGELKKMARSADVAIEMLKEKL